MTRRFKAPKALVLDDKYRVQKPWPSPKSQRWFLLALLLLGAALVLSGQEPLRVARAEGPVSLLGRLLDSQGEPVRGAEVIVREGHGGRPIAIAESQHDGTFVLDLPSRQFSFQMVVEIERPHFQSLEV